MNVRVLALCAIACAVAACPKHPSSSSSMAEDTPNGKLLKDLSVFALGHPLSPDELAEADHKVSSGQETVEQYIDSLLKKPMGGRLAHDLAMGSTVPYKDRHPLPAVMILHSYKDEASGKKIYFLRDKCSASETTSVHPWWAMDSELSVCADSYRPEVMGDAEGHSCGAEMMAPRDNGVCGCGPNLIFCTENKDRWKKATDRVQNEVIATASYVVDNNLPVEQLFTMNETVRTNDAEFVYRRARIMNGEDPKTLLPVTGFGESNGKLKPRFDMIPGQQAGVLSSPSLTYSSDAQRGVMRNYFDWLWCTGVQSSRVTTDAILGLGTVDLRVGDGWKKLASLNVCTDCHARLDYGMQFFQGYPSSTKGVDFRPALSTPGQGPLYRHSIKDAVGTADLTPSGFAKLVTGAPEFGECMSRRVVDHVFNGTDSAADFEAVHDEFTKSHKIKSMLSVAMNRFAKRTPSPPAAPSTDAIPASTSPDKIALSPSLQKMLKADCRECHDKDDSVNLLVPELERSMVTKMIDRVGFGAMPKNTEGIPDRERRALVAELARHLYPTGEERDAAVSYFSDGLQGLPVHRFASAANTIAAIAQASVDNAVASGTAMKDGDGDGDDDDADGDGDGDAKKKKGGKDAKGQHKLKGFRPNTLETSQSQINYSPSVGLATAVAALRSCKEGGLAGADLAACVERGTAPKTVIVGAAPQ